MVIGAVEAGVLGALRRDAFERGLRDDDTGKDHRQPR